MSRNGSGTYTLPAGNPVVTGTTITSSWANTTMQNIADGLTQSVASDGQTPMSGALNMATNKITSLGTPTVSTDAATKAYVDLTQTASGITGGTITGATLTNDTIDSTPIGSTTRSTVKATTLDLGLSTQSVAIGQGNASIMKNRIINGAMVIDQRNAGASVTPTDNQYTLDRWTARVSQASKYTVQQNAGSVTPPAGFNNYLGVTVIAVATLGSTDTFDIQQRIEGFNAADLDWGTANAKTVTLSFWVRSSLTGTFGGSLQNSAFNRSYPFSYSIPSANTWTQISVTIAGDTTGTWLKTNGTGIVVSFGLGDGSSYSGTAGSWSASGLLNVTGATSVVGTNGATFYITGVQLEVGSSATGFEYRVYGTELANCQRYYIKQGDNYYLGATAFTTNRVLASIPFNTTMRTAPTITNSASSVTYFTSGTAQTSSAASFFANSTNGTAQTDVTVTATSGLSGVVTIASGTQFSAEL